MKQTRRQFVRTLFVATQAAAVGSLFPHKLFADDAMRGGLNFLVFGDWGRNGEKDQSDVAAQMAVAAKNVDAKFIISVGDNFYEDGVSSVDDLQWQTSFEKVYSAPSLQVLWHVALGNHDYHGDCDAQIAYNKVSPRWNMPARYYVRTENIDAANAVDFFYLDTTPMATLDADEMMYHGNVKSQDVPRQMAWFKSALKASTAPWKIVIGHHPVYSGGDHGDTPYIVEHILPLLEKYKVHTYFNGHDHDLQHLQAGAVNLFCSGGGSKPRAKIKDLPQTMFAKGCSGFTAVSLQAGKMDVQMVDDKGRLLYTTTVPRVSA
jgi:tartrate-resistant acid phosphatase type 5